MIDILGRYQSSIFLDISHIVPNTDLITEMINLFRDKNLLPSTFQEIVPSKTGSLQRLRLLSSDNEWAINFLSGRISIEKKPISPKGSNVGPIEDFIETSLDFFNRIFGQIKRKGHRLSLITNCLLKELTEEQFYSLFKKLTNPLPFYKDHKPFEWSMQIVGNHDISVDNKDETLNVITRIARISEDVLNDKGIVRLDRIEVHFDINTSPINKDTRFEAGSLSDFYTQAMEIRKNILNEIEEKIQ